MFNAFDLQRFAVTLPDLAGASTATAGKDWKLYINTGTEAIPVWTIIGGQRNSKLSETAETVDVSNKLSGGYTSTIQGMKSWSIDLDGLRLIGDDGVDALDLAMSSGKLVQLKYERPDGKYKTGKAAYTQNDTDTPYDGEASMTGTFEGNGPITAWIPNITPLSVTVSKAAATDQTFTIAPSTTTVSAVKNGATALTVTTNYTYSAGALVIKGTYLSGLTVGTIPLTITTGDGATLTITVVLNA